MVASVTSSPLQFQNALDVARCLYSRGMTPLPIIFGEKRPAIGSGWQTFRTTSEELESHFGGQFNVGILLGDASGRLVDIDLDCDEAVELAPQFLPQTGTSGRHDKPNSHYWYRLAETDETPRTERFQDPTNNSVIVEIRGNGGQTAVWGQHPSGDWYYPPREEAATVLLEQLREAVGQLYAAVLARRGIDPESHARSRTDLASGAAEDPDYNPHNYTHLNDAGFREHRADIETWLKEQEPCIEGQGGDTRLFSVACQLCHGWNLSYSQTLELLREVFNPLCQPAWDDSRLRYKAMAAWTAEAGKSRGYLLQNLRRPASEIQYDEVAKAFLEETAIQGIPTWKLICEHWWHYERNLWNRVHISAVIQAVTRYLRDRYRGTNRAHCTNTVHHVAASVGLPENTCMPSWLPGTDHPDWDPKDCFVSESEVINLQMLLSDEPDYRIPCTPAFFSSTAADYEIPDRDDNTQSPVRWLRFVNEIFGEDAESIQLLRQWLGLLLTNDNSFQKMMFFIGEKRAGKGTILAIIRKLLGEESVVASSLYSLANEFGLQGWMGKKAALFGDVRLGNNKHCDRGRLVERLITISGNDAVEIAVKKKASISTVLSTRLTMASNSTLTISDGSGALSSRFLYLNFPISFFNQEDRGLLGQLKSEIGSIWWWAIEGLRDLYATGRFVQPASSREVALEQGEESNPVLAFVRDQVQDCRNAPNQESIRLSFDRAFEAYATWSRRRNQHPYSYDQFKQHWRKALKDEFGDVETKRSSAKNGRAVQYCGLGVRDN